MIPRECKRLAEVDFPIARVGQHCASAGRKGQPSTLHLWWARRPLAACRAMLLALLLPDPADTACPSDFKMKARNILHRVQGTNSSGGDALRAELLKFVANFAGSDNCAKPLYIETARGLVRAAHGNDSPLILRLLCWRRFNSA